MRLGEDVVLAGGKLATADTTVRFTQRLAWRRRSSAGASPASAPGELVVHLPERPDDPDALSRWAPGFYTVALVAGAPDVPPMSSNELALCIWRRASRSSPATAPAGYGHLTLTCAPRIRDASGCC